jgi:hypothetical protein
MVCAGRMAREETNRKRSLAEHPLADCDYTYDHLKQYFHLPMVEAARSLNVCQSYLKKVCRRNNIDRWPYRKIQSFERAKLAIFGDEERYLRNSEVEHLLEIKESHLLQPELLDPDEVTLIQEELTELSEPSPQECIYQSQFSGEIPFFSQSSTIPRVLRLGHTRADFILSEEANCKSSVFFTGPIELAPIKLLRNRRKLRPVFEPNLLDSSSSHFVPFTLMHPGSWGISLSNHASYPTAQACTCSPDHTALPLSDDLRERPHKHCDRSPTLGPQIGLANEAGSSPIV